MARSVEVPITGRVLDWAIAESGLSISELAAATKLSVEALDDWKAERSRPRLTELRNLAAKLHRPQAVFLLPSPPPVEPVPVQFRSPQPGRLRQLNAVERRYIRRATRFQEILGWLVTELDIDVPGLPRFTTASDSSAAARELRGRFAVSIDDQQAWRTPSAAFDHWRQAAEDLGVSVLLFSMGRSAVQGFSLAHRLAPVIAINTTWREEARIFTLLHEFGHLVTDTSSACSSERVQPGEPVERWCEEFAGQVLVPAEALGAAVRRTAPGAGPVQDLEVAAAIARRFKVSLRATVVALIHANLATWALYREIPAVSDAKPKMGGGTGRSRREIREDQFGKRTAGLFVTAVNRDVISRSQALDYLDIPDVEFDRIPPMNVPAASRQS